MEDFKKFLMEEYKEIVLLVMFFAVLGFGFVKADLDLIRMILLSVTMGLGLSKTIAKK